MELRILTIAHNQLLQLARPRLLLAITCALLLSTWPFFFIAHNVTESADAWTSHLANSLSTSQTFLGFLMMVLAATSVDGEITRRTIMMVMVRPVAAWEYLLGRAAGVAALNVLWTGLVVLAAASAAIYHGTLPPAWFWLQVLLLQVESFGWTLIGMVAGALMSAPVAVCLCTALVLVKGLLTLAPADAGAVLQVLKHAFYYASMASVGSSGTHTTAVFEPLRHTLISLENFLYGVTLFGIGAWMYERRDVATRGG